MMNFTDEQIAVITHTKGPAVCVAGAGSGKTRCLVERTAQLIMNGADPEKILLVTFTRKAASEIKTRIDKRLAQTNMKIEGEVYSSTLHSLALDIFREYSEELGYEDKPTIWQPDVRKRIIKRTVERICKDKKDPFGGKVESDLFEDYFLGSKLSPSDKKLVQSFIEGADQAMKDIPPVPSLIKNRTAQEYLKELRDDGISNDIMQKACYFYLLEKEACCVLEFEDMIPGALKVLSSIPDCKWATQFDHIMVDEYQDCNNINVEFIKALCHKDQQSLLVVGDDDQAIYGFRGGNNKHILNFPKEFGGETYYLTKNFRSAPYIVDMANKLISKNKERYPKTMVPHRQEQRGESCGLSVPFRDIGGKWLHKLRSDQYEEIFHSIWCYIDFAEVSPSDICVLARNNFNLIMAHGVFRQCNRQYPREKQIQFNLSHAASPFENSYIKKVVQWIVILLNKNDHITLREACMYRIKGFGSKKADYLQQAQANNPEGSLYDWLIDLKNYPRITEKSAFYVEAKKFAETYKAAKESLDKSPTILNLWTYALILSGIQKSFDDAQLGKHDNKTNQKLVNFQATLEEATEIVQEIQQNNPNKEMSVLLDEITLDITRSNEQEAVSMMTIHSSKGKEWPIVIVIDIDDKTLPNEKFDVGIEEERRLFYVAITRAEDHLILSYARGDRNIEQYSSTGPSMFWSELNLLQKDYYHEHESHHL